MNPQYYVQLSRNLIPSKLFTRAYLFWIVFLLRVNPLTSSDFVSYAAGATTMPLWKLMLGTFLGMAPLCWAQSYLADEILTAYPKLIYPLLIACAVYTVVVVLVARKMMKQVASEAAL